MEMASAVNLSERENCGEPGNSVTERVSPDTQRIVQYELIQLEWEMPISSDRRYRAVVMWGTKTDKQKTPAPDSARAFCNARRSQVNEGSLTRNEI